MLHYYGTSNRTACGALAAPGELTLNRQAVQCPACLKEIRIAEPTEGGPQESRTVTQLFDFHPGERVISAGQYHDCIIVTTTDRVWRMDCPDDDQNMKMQIVSELRGLIP